MQSQSHLSLDKNFCTPPTPGLPEAALVQKALAAHLAGELLPVAVQQVLELHVGGGRGPARRLLVLHLAHGVGEGQRLGGMVVLRAQLLGPRLHVRHHVLVVAAHLLPGSQRGQVEACLCAREWNKIVFI